MEEKTMNIEQAAANQAAATAEEYTLNFTGEETDNILQHAEKLRSQTETSDGNMADTVQVYDTDGVPHTISKTELISKAGVNLPSLDQIGGFVAYDKEGNALGLMSTEQVAEVVGERLPKASGVTDGLVFKNNAYLVNGIAHWMGEPIINVGKINSTYFMALVCITAHGGSAKVDFITIRGSGVIVNTLINTGENISYSLNQNKELIISNVYDRFLRVMILNDSIDCIGLIKQ